MSEEQGSSSCWLWTSVTPEIKVLPMGFHFHGHQYGITSIRQMLIGMDNRQWIYTHCSHHSIAEWREQSHGFGQNLPKRSIEIS
jgi:hypothetical protein